MASDLSVTVNVRVAIKESVTISEDECAGTQINDEKKRPADSKSRQRSRIDYAKHDF